MTRHCLLPPCAISLEASYPCLPLSHPCSGLPSSSPAPDGWHSRRTLAKTDVFIFRRQNVVLLQMAMPWSKWQPLTLLLPSPGILAELAFGDREVEKKIKMFRSQLMEFCASAILLDLENNFLSHRPQLTSQLTGFSQWAKSYVSMNYFSHLAFIGHKVKPENIDNFRWVLSGFAKHICIPGCSSQGVS